MSLSKRFTLKNACLVIPLGAIVLLVLILAASALSNLGLPQQSSTVDHLSDLEKARLSEVLHLRSSLGEAVWPGWSEADIPLIVYNEQYAFLLGYPDPADGWKKVPTMEMLGGPWEEVSGDTFEGSPYYRTPITGPEKTPQGFTVLVGNRWVATFQTREYGQVAFYRGFRQELPPFISTFVPVRLVWALLMAKTESYVAAIEHESFHAFEGGMATDQLNASESMYEVEASYPYDAMNEPWMQEMNMLLQAINAGTEPEAISLSRQFLQMRETRRSQLTSQQVDLERLREWEEGLAKYAELEIMRLAETSEGYLPIDGLSQDKSFHDYQGQQQFWATQLKEAKNVSGRSGDTRFYYSGNALAVLLDRLAPDWKARALPGGEYLDELLQATVK